mgnify:FL=1
MKRKLKVFLTDMIIKFNNNDKTDILNDYNIKI